MGVVPAYLLCIISVIIYKCRYVSVYIYTVTIMLCNTLHNIDLHLHRLTADVLLDRRYRCSSVARPSRLLCCFFFLFLGLCFPYLQYVLMTNSSTCSVLPEALPLYSGSDRLVNPASNSLVIELSGVFCIVMRSTASSELSPLCVRLRRSSQQVRAYSSKAEAYKSSDDV
jgi:hypothetical protein